MKTYEEDLAFMDDGLRRLKVEYDIYLNGHRKKPPEDLRLRVEKIVRKLAEVADMSFAERFRYNTLLARYYVYKDRWRKLVQAKEEGLREKETKSPIHPQRETPVAPKEAPQPSGIRVSIGDPTKEEEKVRELYEYVQEMRGKQANQPTTISFQQFQKYISTQTQNIRGKYGCSSVEFNISLEENSIKFTARAEGER